MAEVGASYIKFNRIKEEPKGKLPVYSDEDPVQLGRLVRTDLSVKLASGRLYADDELAESADVFSSGSLKAETDDMEDSVASVVFGCEVDGKEVHYKSGDAPPEGGLAHYKTVMRRGKQSYKGVFYPRTKAALGDDTSQTRGENITFSTKTTTFTVFVCKSGDWRITHEFDTVEEAMAWVDGKLSNAGVQPGDVSG